MYGIPPQGRPMRLLIGRSRGGSPGHLHIAGPSDLLPDRQVHCGGPWATLGDKCSEVFTGVQGAKHCFKGSREPLNPKECLRIPSCEQQAYKPKRKQATNQATTPNNQPSNDPKQPTKQATTTLQQAQEQCLSNSSHNPYPNHPSME